MSAGQSSGQEQDGGGVEEGSGRGEGWLRVFPEPPICLSQAKKPSNVINLMDALKQSIAVERGGEKPAPARGSGSRKSAAKKPSAKHAAKAPRKARKAG
jgi:hypothetical protein